jgi:hypothetical protein
MNAGRSWAAPGGANSAGGAPSVEDHSGNQRMRIDVPPAALAAGFSNEPIGTHTSKTMMLRELRDVLAARSEGSIDDYRVASLDDNQLHKSTAATRRKTFNFLRHLYALDSAVPVFAALRALWDHDALSQPLIAISSALARDPLLRSTASCILSLAPAVRVTPELLAAEVASAFPNRYGPGTLHHVGQNTSSSWQQAGFLEGRRRKFRKRPQARDAALVYALFLGHLEGQSGPALFGTLWASLLEADQGWMVEHAEAAARAGWIDYAKSGGMLAIGFDYLDGLSKQAA